MLIIAIDSGIQHYWQPLRLFCRHDPAWKALYSLYNPDNLQGRSAGLQYSLENRQAIQKKVAARAAATAAAAAAERAAEQHQKPSPKKKVCRSGNVLSTAAQD
jgi:hypothetical protein